MTLDIRKIWISTNKVLTRINIFFLQVILMSPFDPKKFTDRKIPVVFNILLLLILGAVLFILTYGAYRQANS